jgi:uncharacterized membrane protein
MKKIIFILAIALTFTSCYYDKADVLYGGSTVDCTTISAKFTTDINPIIQTKCAIGGCHNASAAGGVQLLNYTQIKANITHIEHRVLMTKDMPVGGALPLAEQDKIRCWINNGSLNN